MIQHFGENGVALGTLAISVHTFAILFLKWNVPTTRLLPIGVIGVMVLFLTLTIVLCHTLNTEPAFYGPATYWCWINANAYDAEKIGLEYGIFWFVAAVNIVLYVPLFFVLRGNIKVSFDSPPRGSTATRGRMRVVWKSIPKEKAWLGSGRRESQAAAVAKQMLAYPVVYGVLSFTA